MRDLYYEGGADHNDAKGTAEDQTAEPSEVSLKELECWTTTERE